MNHFNGDPVASTCTLTISQILCILTELHYSKSNSTIFTPCVWIQKHLCIPLHFLLHMHTTRVHLLSIVSWKTKSTLYVSKVQCKTTKNWWEIKFVHMYWLAWQWVSEIFSWLDTNNNWFPDNFLNFWIFLQSWITFMELFIWTGMLLCWLWSI